MVGTEKEKEAKNEAERREMLVDYIVTVPVKFYVHAKNPEQAEELVTNRIWESEEYCRADTDALTSEATVQKNKVSVDFALENPIPDNLDEAMLKQERDRCPHPDVCTGWESNVEEADNKPVKVCYRCGEVLED